MKKTYPCDAEPHACPFLSDGESTSTPMYFCRDNCGLGVDESEIDEPTIYKKQYEDCYEQCGGEDCACCGIHMDHQADARYPLDSDDYSPEWDEDCRHSYYPDDDDCEEDCDDCPYTNCECRR